MFAAALTFLTVPRLSRPTDEDEQNLFPCRCLEQERVSEDESSCWKTALKREQLDDTKHGDSVDRCSE